MSEKNINSASRVSTFNRAVAIVFAHFVASYIFVLVFLAAASLRHATSAVSRSEFFEVMQAAPVAIFMALYLLARGPLRILAYGGLGVVLYGVVAWVVYRAGIASCRTAKIRGRLPMIHWLLGFCAIEMLRPFAAHYVLDLAELFLSVTLSIHLLAWSNRAGTKPQVGARD